MHHSLEIRTGLGFALLVFGASACGAQQAEHATVPVVGGTYVWGAEVNVFSPCGSDLEYWVAGEPRIIQALQDRYAALGLAPYQVVFVEVRGEVGPVLDCAFCEEYDGSFKVEELIEMNSPVPEECETKIAL